MSAQTQWFYDPEMLPGGPKCPDCRSTGSPRLVTFDGIDSGTGEQIHEERFRCSCGFVGESEEFQAGVGSDGDELPRPFSGLMTTGLPGVITDAQSAPRTMDGKATGDIERPRGLTGIPVRTGTPAPSSPRIERGTEDGSSCPF